MPLPLLLGGAAILATVVGASSHKNAVEVNEKAEWASYKAQNLYNEAKESFLDAKDDAEMKLLKLGHTKKSVLDDSMKQFVQVYDRIKNIQLRESSGLNEISNFAIEQQDVVQIAEMVNIYSDSMQSGVAGMATGAVIALAASGNLPMITGALSLAGTCLASGSVGAAASIVGTAVSKTVTVTPLAAVVAPAVFFTGISASMKADENLEKADRMYAEAEKASEEMKISETLCTAIGERAEMLNDLLVNLNNLFSDSTEMLCKVLEKKDGVMGKGEIKVDDLSEEELMLIAVTRSLAGAVKAIIDTPILSKDGSLTNESLNIYDNTNKSLPQFSETVLEVKKLNGEDVVKETKNINVVQKRATITAEDTVRSVCWDFIQSHDNELEFCIRPLGGFDFGDVINDPNAVGDACLVHDDVPTEHGWNGFVITEGNITCRKPSFEKSTSVSFRKLTKTKEVYIKGKSIYADKESLAFYSGEENVREQLRELLEKIVLIAKRDA